MSVMPPLHSAVNPTEVERRRQERMKKREEILLSYGKRAPRVDAKPCIPCMNKARRVKV